MISWLAALTAVVLAAATTLPSSAQGAIGDVRMDVVSVAPSPPRAAQPFELVARIEFAPAPGSIRCSVWIGGKRFRNIRLEWVNSVARCHFRVPADRARQAADHRARGNARGLRDANHADVPGLLRTGRERRRARSRSVSALPRWDRRVLGATLP